MANNSCIKPNHRITSNHSQTSVKSMRAPRYFASEVGKRFMLVFSLAQVANQRVARRAAAL